MKTLILQDVVTDINIRMNLFEKMRIVNKTVDNNVNLKKTNDKEVVNKNNTNEVLVEEKNIITEILFDNNKKEIIVEDKPIDLEIVAKNSNLSIVTDELINQNDFVKKELSEIDMAKLANFKKNDDFFFDEVTKVVENPKKGTPNFFKAISGFFNDITKDQVVQEKPNSDIKLKPQRNEVDAETAKPELEPEIEQVAIDAEKAIKAEKLRLIEEEFRLKAEKREVDEKLLLEQQEPETAKSNADFRNNKRKK